MLTAKESLDDKMHGFEIGADDYLTKPFYLDELKAYGFKPYLNVQVNLKILRLLNMVRLSSSIRPIIK